MVLGRDSIADAIDRATEIILIDMPLWMLLWIHLRLAAERQNAWAADALGHAPGRMAHMPPTQGLFQTTWQVDQDGCPAFVPCARRATHRVSSSHAWVA
jgi:hypothetical protein